MEENRKIHLERENYITLCGWMITELKLSGNELLVYAVIYSFSQDKNNWCYAGLEYIAEWLGSSIRTVQRTIDSLIEKKLVVRRVSTDSTGRFNEYKAFKKPIEGDDNLSLSTVGGSRQIDGGVMTKTEGGHDKSGNYTILDNKDNKDNKERGANAPRSSKNSRFVKPTVDEIAAYCREKNYCINAQSFFDFYESKGWKVGNSPMKDWHAAIRTWVNRSNNAGYGRYTAPVSSCGNNNPEGFSL